jgi:hypothetical protein
MVKERKVLTSFKTKDVTNLNEVMKRFGDRYRTGDSIYSKEGDRLLLAPGKSVSPERFESMERELRQAKLKNKPSPYYTQLRTDYSYSH